MIRKLLLTALLTLPMLLSPVTAEEVNTFSLGGEEIEEVTIRLSPGEDSVSNITVSVRGEIKSVEEFSLRIATGAGPPYPSQVGLDLGADSLLEWGFGGPPFGSFGEQSGFMDTSRRRVLHPSSNTSTGFLLPEGALVRGGKVDVEPLPIPGRGEQRWLSPGEGCKWTLPLEGGVELLALHYTQDAYQLEILRPGEGDFSRSVIKGGLSSPLYPVPLRSLPRSAILYTDAREISTREVYLLLNGTLLGGFDVCGWPVWAEGFSGRGGVEVAILTQYPSYLYHISTSRMTASSVRLSKSVYSPVLFKERSGNCSFVAIVDDTSYLKYLKVPLTPPFRGAEINTTFRRREYSEQRFILFSAGRTLLLYSPDNRTLFRVHLQEGRVDHLPLGRLGGSSSPWSLKSFGSPTDGVFYLLAWNQRRDLTIYAFSEGMGEYPPILKVSRAFYYCPPAAVFTPEYLTIFGPRVYGGTVLVLDYPLRRYCVLSTPAGMEKLVGGERREVVEPSHIRSTGRVLTDGWGNAFKEVYLPFQVVEGMALLKNLSVTYSLNVTISTLLNATLKDYLSGVVSRSGDLPIKVVGTGPGLVVLSSPHLLWNAPPEIFSPLPGQVKLRMGGEEVIIDLSEHFRDDMLPPDELQYSVETYCLPGIKVHLEGSILRIGPPLTVVSPIHGTIQVTAYDGVWSVDAPPIELIVVRENEPPEITIGSLEFTVRGDSGTLLDLERTPPAVDPEGKEILYYLLSGEKALLTYITDAFSLEIRSGHLLMGWTRELYAESEVEVQLLASDEPLSPLPHAPGAYSVPERLNRSVVKLVLKLIPSNPVSVKLPYRLNMLEDSPPTTVPLKIEGDFKGVTLRAKCSLQWMQVRMGESNITLTPQRNCYGEGVVVVEAFKEGEVVGSGTMWVVVVAVDDPIWIKVEGKRMGEEGVEIWGVAGDEDDPVERVLWRVDSGEWSPAEGTEEWSIFLPYDLLSAGEYRIQIRALTGDKSSLPAAVQISIPSPFKPVDSDGDGYPDFLDAFPNDPMNWQDYDGDGVGDADDAFPLDPNEWKDSDGDGVGDNSDPFPLSPGWDFTPTTGKEVGRAELIGVLLLGGGILALIMYVMFGTLIFALAVNLYSKLSKKDVLDHEIRGLIRGYIIANPGDHYSNIKRNLNLNNGTLAYHLRVLEKHGFIRSEIDGMYRRYYPTEVSVNQVRGNITKQEEIFNKILERPGITVKDIARELGISRQIVNYHVKNLIRAQLVTWDRSDSITRFFPAQSEEEETP